MHSMWPAASPCCARTRQRHLRPHGQSYVKAAKMLGRWHQLRMPLGYMALEFHNRRPFVGTCSRDRSVPSSSSLSRSTSISSSSVSSSPRPMPALSQPPPQVASCGARLGSDGESTLLTERLGASTLSEFELPPHNTGAPSSSARQHQAPLRQLGGGMATGARVAIFEPRSGSSNQARRPA